MEVPAARILLLQKGAESSLPPRQNTFLSIFVTQKHFSDHPYNAKTLFPKLPKYIWQHLATIRKHLVTIWQHLVTTWQHLVPNNLPKSGPKHCSPYSVETDKIQISRLFSPESCPTGPVPEINVPDHAPDHHAKISSRLDQPAQTSSPRNRQTTTTARQHP